MSWLGLRYKGYEILYPDEWNRVVDGLDILYAYVSNHESRLDCVERWCKPANRLETFSKSVGTTPVPITDTDMEVKGIHVKVPSSATALLYVGDSSKQEYILEPGDETRFHVINPKNVYVKSNGNIVIYVALEVD